MHFAAVLFVAVAGICYCLAAGLRWRLVRADHPAQARWLWPLWLGLLLHSAGLVITMLEGRHPDFAYAVLGVWAALAALVFVSRFLASPSRWLLALPVGAMAILVGMAGLLARPEEGEKHPVIVTVHVLFMTGWLCTALVAGGAGLLYLLAVRQLKGAKIGALRLPTLPDLGKLCERTLVVATALLLGGLATGGAAMRAVRTIDLWQPPTALAMLNMLLLVAALALHRSGHLGRKGLAGAAVATLVIGAIASLALVLGPHA